MSQTENAYMFAEVKEWILNHLAVHEPEILNNAILAYKIHTVENKPQPELPTDGLWYDEKSNSLCGTYREVAGIVYEIAQGYGSGEDAKAYAMVEAHFQRECNNKYARAMRVIHGDSKGSWACYVSMCDRGE